MCVRLLAKTNRQGHRSATLGFTLIELVVVIAIFGLLAAILIPAISLVRDSARLMNCASNLRQIGTAIVVYTQDARGLLPYFNGVTINHRGHEGGPLDYLMADSLGFTMAADQVVNSSTGNRVFVCPAGPYRRTQAQVLWNGIKTVWVDGQGTAGLYDDRNSYEGSMYYLYENSNPVYSVGPNKNGRDLRLSALARPAQTPWQFCSNRGAPGTGGFAGLQGYAMHRRYERPTLFLDGHMKVLVSNLGKTGGGNNLDPSVQSLMVPPFNPWNPTFEYQFPEY